METDLQSVNVPADTGQDQDNEFFPGFVLIQFLTLNVDRLFKINLETGGRPLHLKAPINVSLIDRGWESR